MERIEALLGDAIQQARAFAYGLNPVPAKPSGLTIALKELAARTQAHYPVDFVCRWPRPVRLADHFTATQLFHIAREAVHNAIQHGRAKQIRLELRANSQRTILAIRDDGKGFPRRRPRQGGMGLRNMAHRAEVIGATLTFGPGRAGGTVVLCRMRPRAAVPSTPPRP
jgi:signal transduction histidine kinase